MDSRDLIDDEHDSDDDGYGREPGSGLLSAVTAPEVLALASVVLAVVSITGLGLLNGSVYVQLGSYTGDAPQQAVLVGAALLGVGLALLPAALGGLALRRLPDDSPSRVLAGAGVLIAAVSALLRLVMALRAAADDTVQYVPF